MVDVLQSCLVIGCGIATAERNGVLRIEDSRILAGDEFNIVRVADMATAYSLIEEDLKEAIPNLPVKQDLPYEATKGAAQALLGKVYLYHGTLDGSKSIPQVLSCCIEFQKQTPNHFLLQFQIIWCSQIQ